MTDRPPKRHNNDAPRQSIRLSDTQVFGCADTDCITLSITFSACPIIAPKDATEYDFIVINIVLSLCLCLRVVATVLEGRLCRPYISLVG